MGNSAKRKKEKKQDFKKPKLKVGKARPKPSNQTDTSFRSKAIVLNQQSLTISAPTADHQFQHHVSLLSSRSDSQRKDSSAFLTTFVSTNPVDAPLPQPMGTLLEKLCPLILDGNTGVRTQVLKLFQSFRTEGLRDHVSKILPFIRAGMTHLSKDIRLSTIDLLSWLLEVVGEDVVSCPGGWVKTLESFVTLLGWKMSNTATKWSATKTAFGSDTKTTVRVMQVLAKLLRIGVEMEGDSAQSVEQSMVALFPLWHVDEHRVPLKSNAYFYLDLFGTQQVEESLTLEDRNDRIRLFNERFRDPVTMGIEAAKQEGGEFGRAAGLITKALKLADVG